MSKILKMKFYEHEELSKVLANSVYVNIVKDTDYGTEEISKDNILSFLAYCEKFAEETPYTSAEVQDEIKNVLGEDYDLLMDDELDFIQVVY